MKTREIICQHYICAHKCEKNRDAEHYKLCQKCPFYQPKKGGKPIKHDTRREKLDKAARKEMRYDKY